MGGSVEALLGEGLVVLAGLLGVENLVVLVGHPGVGVDEVLVDAGVRVLAVHCLIIKLLS